MANTPSKYDAYSDAELYETTKTADELPAMQISGPLLTAIFLPPVAFVSIYFLLKLIGWL